MYIDEFLKTFQIKTSRSNEYIIDLLTRFVYSTLNSHIDIYKKLVCKDNTKIELPSEVLEYTDDDKDIIDSFLKWDNPDKDKAVYDVICLSMEYCMLSNKKDINRQLSHSLKDKSIYLDTIQTSFSEPSD